MKKWLQTQLAELDSTPDDVAGEHLAAIIADAERRAAVAGLPDAVTACQIRPGPVGTELARRVLAKCLAACPDDPSGSLSVKQAATQLGVSKETVYKLCEEHALDHTRIGRRIVITPQQLDEYRQGGGFRHL